FSGEIGFTSLFSGKLFRRPLDIEATFGLEQPFQYQKGSMHMSLRVQRNVDFSIHLPQSSKTRVSGGLNVGYNIFKPVTIFGGYEVISGGNWDHIATAGVRICL